MKKLFCVVALVVAVGGGAAVAQSHSLDLVVLVDSSESMIPYWHDTTDYLIRNILTGVLHKGDSFHLISFASRPEVEISRKIESENDVHAVLSRFLLLQPLGRYTDLVAAIQYLYSYVIDLPLSTQKEIIILTDGIDDPPPESSFPITGANGANIARNRRLIVETAQEMRRQGWTVHIIQYPIAGTQAAGPPQPGVQLLGETEAQAAAPGVGPAAKPGQKQSGGATLPAGRATSAGRAGGAPTAGTGGAGTPSPTAGASPGPRGAAGAGASSGAPSGVGRAAGTGTAGGSPTPAATPGPTGSTGSASGKKAPLLNALSQTLGVPIQQYEGVNKENLANVATGSPEVLFPKNLGRIGYRASVPFTIRNFQGQAILVRLTGVIFDGANLLRRPVGLPVRANSEATLKAPLVFPRSLSPGAHSIDIELQFSDSLRESPHNGSLSFTLRKGAIGTRAYAYLVPILIGIVLIVVLVLIVLLARRFVANLRASPSAAPPMRFDAAKGAIQPIELRVTGQNPNIGARNIHPIGTGGRRAVGGGGSAFLIYLYPCPPRIAEIVREGESYTLVPLRPEFFPTLSGDLRDCLGKEILVQADGGHRLAIIFRRYVSPLDEVNRIMHLADRPGTPTAGVT